MGVYVQTESNTFYRGYNHDEGDGTPYSSYDHEVMSYDGCKVFEYTDKVEGRLGWRTKKFDVEARAGDVVFVVVAVYTTGGTFGCSEGNTSVLAVFKDADSALRLKQFVEDDYRGYQGRTGVNGGWQLEFEGTEIYAEWKGYFESLDSVHVEMEVVRA